MSLKELTGLNKSKVGPVNPEKLSRDLLDPNAKGGKISSIFLELLNDFGLMIYIMQ